MVVYNQSLRPSDCGRNGTARRTCFPLDKLRQEWQPEQCHLPSLGPRSVHRSEQGWFGGNNRSVLLLGGIRRYRPVGQRFPVSCRCKVQRIPEIRPVRGRNRLPHVLAHRLQPGQNSPPNAQTNPSPNKRTDGLPHVVTHRLQPGSYSSTDTGTDTGTDPGPDSSTNAGANAGTDPGPYSSTDTGTDTGTDPGPYSSTNTGTDTVTDIRTDNVSTNYWSTRRN